jgi:hypothetical protein
MNAMAMTPRMSKTRKVLFSFARADVSLRRVDELAVDQGRSKLIDVSGPR